jgi:hypothetical protein
MTNATATIRFFGVYLLCVGLVLVGTPALLAGLLQIPVEAHPWLRPLGVALLALSYYYFRAAFSQNREFYRWTVDVRIGQFVLFVVIVSMGTLSPLILIPSAFEFGTAVWTWFALRDDAHHERKEPSNRV